MKNVLIRPFFTFITINVHFLCAHRNSEEVGPMGIICDITNSLKAGSGIIIYWYVSYIKKKKTRIFVIIC